MYDAGETSNQIFCVKKVLYHTGLVLLLLSDSSLDFNYTEIGDLKKLKIAPFILINFIENAFKYGFNAEENSKISVKIIVQEGILNFVVYNKIVNKKGAFFKTNSLSSVLTSSISAPESSLLAGIRLQYLVVTSACSASTPFMMTS